MRCHLVLFIMIAAVLLPGCQTIKPNAGNQGMSAATRTRNQGYALLYSTVDDEADVDKAMFLKSPSPEVSDLIKAIAELARTSRKRIEILAKEQPTVDLTDQGLPEIEARTRSAISSATGKQILMSGGKTLEFNLLMTQHEALNYITRLAEVLASQDTNDGGRHYFAQLAKDADALHERVIDLLKSPYLGQGK